VWAMVELQWLTGMRSGEVTRMRTGEIDTTGKLWIYRPSRHKTQHHATRGRCTWASGARRSSLPSSSRT